VIFDFVADLEVQTCAFDDRAPITSFNDSAKALISAAVL
jgi:hypothetical protein